MSRTLCRIAMALSLVPAVSATPIYDYLYTGNHFEASFVKPPYTASGFISVEMLIQHPILGSDFEQPDAFLRITMSDGVQTMVFDRFRPDNEVEASDVMLWEPWRAGQNAAMMTVNRPAYGGGSTQLDTVSSAEFLNERIYAAVYGDPGVWRLSEYEDPSVRYFVPEPTSLLLLASGIISLIGFGWRNRRE
jgi:hypothetical protein